MNKKILFALTVVLVAVAAIGTVSAFDFSDLGALFGGAPPDQNVTLDGEHFKIPGTFKENKNISKNGTVNDYVAFKSTEYAIGFKNDTNYINILISDYNTTDVGKDLINYMNGTSKDVSGVQGYIYKDDVGYTYTYGKGSKVISIQSDNESLIGPVIA